jgi:hypothetical protein
MRNLGRAVLVAAFALAASPSVSSAKDLPAGGLTRQEVVDWLVKHGQKAKLDYDTVAKDSTVTVTSADGTWSMYFYNCSGERCKSLQYAAGWSSAPPTVAQVNDWNNNRRFLRAYRTPSDAVFAEYDLDINSGTWGALDYSLERWNKQLAVFRTFMKTGTVPSN